METSPKKLDWQLVPELRAGILYAETRLSDLICQNDCQALEFKGYGKVFITTHGFSPDAFVQMAFQAAYYGLYGQLCSAFGVVFKFMCCRSDGVYLRAGDDKGVLAWQDRGHSNCSTRVCGLHEGERIGLILNANGH